MYIAGMPRAGPGMSLDQSSFPVSSSYARTLPSPAAWITRPVAVTRMPFLAPTPQERAKLEPLPPPERKRELDRLLREKVRTHLREVVGLPPEEADRIAGLPREGMLEELRRVDPGRFPGPGGPSPRGPR